MENVFKNKNFVLSFFGGLVSNIGAIFYSFAVSFYILDITGNNAIVQNNYLALCSVGLVLATIPGGVISDRYNRAKIMYICDYIKGAIVLLTTFLLLRFPDDYSAQLTVLFVAGFFGNVVSGIFSPASGALLPQIVKEEQFQQANSYQSALQGFQSIAGVLLAGILYSMVPANVIFMIVGACYLASGVSEMFIKYDFVPAEGRLTVRTALTDLKEGISYTVAAKAVLALIICSTFINFFFNPIGGSFFPYFSKTDIAGAPSYLFDSFLTPELWTSIFSMADGAGMIIMALILSGRPQKERCAPLLRRGLTIMTGIMVSLTACYYVFVDRGVGLNYLLILFPLGCFAIGATCMHVNINAATSMMRKIDKDKMGKVMSFLGISNQALTPLASVISGLIISKSGLSMFLLYTSVGLMLAMVFCLRNKGIDEI